MRQGSGQYNDEIRCQKCNRVIGYGTGVLTCVWCSDAPDSAREDALNAALENAKEMRNVARGTL